MLFRSLYKETKGVKTLRRAIADTAFWRGGTESFVFNTLEAFAEQEQPRTPALGAGITEALRKRYINKGSFMTSRINWAIQSSGVDYLHLLIVSMDYLVTRFNLNARLALTVHDEIRYLVKNEDRYKAAMALQVANIWTRAMFSQQVGIEELPQSCAFFSSIDIDHVLRKEVDMDCVTPSNPEKIAPGESLDISQLIAKGREAELDLNVVSDQDYQNPLQWSYQPRTSVMAEIQSGNLATLGMMKAQITNDESELKEILKQLGSAKSALSKVDKAKKRQIQQGWKAAPPQEVHLPDLDYDLLNSFTSPALRRGNWKSRNEASTRSKIRQVIATA